MNRSSRLGAAALSLAALCLSPAVLASGSTSSASSASSTAGAASSGTMSDSFETSSDGSSAQNNKVAAGEYRVVDVAAAPGRPGTLRLQLVGAEATATPEFVLFVPTTAVADRPVAAGDHVLTRVRPYGFEFAHADTRRAFYLAIQDDWHRDLSSHVVSL